MRANAMRFVVLRGVRGSATDAKDVCLRLIDLFWNIFPPEPVDELQTLVAIFPDLPKDEAAVFIDGGHELVRHQFLAAHMRRNNEDRQRCPHRVEIAHHLDRSYGTIKWCLGSCGDVVEGTYHLNI